MKKHILLPVFLLIIAYSVTSCADNSGGSRLDGGSCKYRDYEGIVTIKEIHRDSSETSPIDPQQKTFISFTFVAEEDAPPEAREFSDDIEVINSQIDQKEVRVGKQFRTKASYIIKGTCAPGPYMESFEKWQ